MDHLIYNLANFYRILLGPMVDGKMLAVSTVAVSAVWGGLSALYILRQFLNWDAPDRTLLKFAKANGKLVVLNFLVLASPTIVASLASATGAQVLEAANGPIVDEAQRLHTTMWDTTKAMVEMVPAYAHAMYQASLGEYLPTTLSSVTGIDDSLSQATLQNAKRNQAAAMRDLNAQLTSAKLDAASSNPDRARIGAQNVADIQQRIREINDTIAKLEADAKPAPPPPKEDGWLSKISGGINAGITWVTAIGTTVMTSIPMSWAYLASIMTLLPGILLGLWGVWKLVGSCVELFSYLFSTAAKIAICGLISVGLAPLSLMTLLEPATQEYGKHFISWWYQVLVGVIGFGIAARLASYGIGGITDSVAGYGVELTRRLLGNLIGTADVAVPFASNVAAGMTLLSVSYAFAFISNVVRGVVSSATGMVVGRANL